MVGSKGGQEVQTPPLSPGMDSPWEKQNNNILRTSPPLFSNMHSYLEVCNMPHDVPFHQSLHCLLTC